MLPRVVFVCVKASSGAPYATSAHIAGVIAEGTDEEGEAGRVWKEEEEFATDESLNTPRPCTVESTLYESMMPEESRDTSEASHAYTCDETQWETDIPKYSSTMVSTRLSKMPNGNGLEERNGTKKAGKRNAEPLTPNP